MLSDEKIGFARTNLSSGNPPLRGLNFAWINFRELPGLNNFAWIYFREDREKLHPPPTITFEPKELKS